MNFRGLLAALSALCLTGCWSAENVDAKHVRSEAIHQSLHVWYAAAADESLTSARFRVGGPLGTNLDLTGESSVTCNGEPLAPAMLLGRYYASRRPGFAGEYAFVFTDGDGKAWRNTLRLQRADFPADFPRTISRGRREPLNFAGPPLAAGEAISLLIVDAGKPLPDLLRDGPEALRKRIRNDPAGAAEALRKERGTWQLLGYSATVGATGVVPQPEILQSLGDAPLRLQWARTVDIPLQESTPEGGTLAGSYISAPIEFTPAE